MSAQCVCVYRGRALFSVVCVLAFLHDTCIVSARTADARLFPLCFYHHKYRTQITCCYDAMRASVRRISMFNFGYYRIPIIIKPGRGAWCMQTSSHFTLVLCMCVLCFCVCVALWRAFAYANYIACCVVPCHAALPTFVNHTQHTIPQFCWRHDFVCFVCG